jgi:hypothetical protein
LKNFIKYLFSDKDAKPYWIAYYTSIGLLYLFFFVSGRGERESVELSVFGIAINLLLLFVFFFYYSYSYYYYRLQGKFIKMYSENIDLNSLIEINVGIIPESYFITAPKSNFVGKINPKEKRTKVRICRIKNQFIILGHTYHFGVFKQHIRPLTFTVDKKELPEKLTYTKFIDNGTIEYKDNQLQIINNTPIYGVKGIIFKEWKDYIKIKNNCP